LSYFVDVLVVGLEVAYADDLEGCLCECSSLPILFTIDM